MTWAPNQPCSSLPARALWPRKIAPLLAARAFWNGSSTVTRQLPSTSILDRSTAERPSACPRSWRHLDRCVYFFPFPSYISGVHHFWVRFLRMWPFFNPTIAKVVTFSLGGWCVLGVFLLPAFTRLGHERQDLLSPCDEMHVCTD